jgi:hypothetical protein
MTASLNPTNKGDTTMRYIIQDNYTGYIWGDSADFGANPENMTDACRMLDESLGEHGRVYSEVPRLSGDSGYVVYRADINGSEAVTVIHDGQDRETIEAVERDCRLLGYVEFNRDPDA